MKNIMIDNICLAHQFSKDGFIGLKCILDKLCNFIFIFSYSTDVKTEATYEGFPLAHLVKNGMKTQVPIENRQIIGGDAQRKNQKVKKMTK